MRVKKEAQYEISRRQIGIQDRRVGYGLALQIACTEPTRQAYRTCWVSCCEGATWLAARLSGAQVTCQMSRVSCSCHSHTTRGNKVGWPLLLARIVFGRYLHSGLLPYDDR